MTDIGATPPVTLTRAREIALRAGLNYVYTGNVRDESRRLDILPIVRASR